MPGHEPSFRTAEPSERITAPQPTTCLPVTPLRKLKNPILRKSIAEVASLRQAAAVGRIPVSELVNRLRDVVGQVPLEGDGADSTAEYCYQQPAWFDEGRVVSSIDDRTGDENTMAVTRVAAAAARLGESELLELVTTFIPAPGIDLMRRKGYQSWTRPESDGVVRTYFVKG